MDFFQAGLTLLCIKTEVAVHVQLSHSAVQPVLHTFHKHPEEVCEVKVAQQDVEDAVHRGESGQNVGVRVVLHQKCLQ